MKQIYQWGITYVHLVTTEHKGSTCAHHYPHTKFHHCSPYRTGYLMIVLLLANQNKYANEVLNMCIWWKQTTWVVLVPITTHIPSFISVVHTELWIFDFFVISQSEQICEWGVKYVHSVTTDYASRVIFGPPVTTESRGRFENGFGYFEVFKKNWAPMPLAKVWAKHRILNIN